MIRGRRTGAAAPMRFSCKKSLPPPSLLVRCALFDGAEVLRSADGLIAAPPRGFAFSCCCASLRSALRLDCSLTAEMLDLAWFGGLMPARI